MKIFNWVHKRFHHNPPKDGFASNMKKNEPTINNVDSQALPKQVALTDLLGGWNDGILTIGTLGYDPLKSINHSKEYFALETDDDQDNAEQEDLNPLMHNTFEHNFEDVVSENHDANARTEEVVRTFNEIVQAPPVEVVRTFNEIVQAPPVISHEVMESNDEEIDQKKKKGERITLYDLFLADSDVKLKLDPAKAMLESSEKQSLKTKHGLSFAKKLIPRVKDNPHPMKEIKKLMKKMLKRKIHPDLDVKNHKPEGQEVSTAGIMDN
ncbi:protein TILLER ANGLE CONTROL 1-like [Gastrolobium bilobum]|uniref:protein TILLER ANGLE CONTROL 1-like n=1 Tax=Gastrolobium bilobum TaxID=150636 RepID=UPI002AB16D17|nr:protein TILLER ANGLE CONTROL 1-like [Gastrolobium bilobum]